jgi:hypothetical protein
VDWADLHRWKMINKALDLPFDEPQETYSTSEHLFHDLGIPAGTKGRIVDPAPLPPREPREDRGGSRDRGPRERAPRARSRERTRTRSGEQVAAGSAEKQAAPAAAGAGDERPAGQGRNRRRRRRSSGPGSSSSPAAPA